MNEKNYESNVLQHLSNWLTYKGELEQAYKHLNRALNLNPKN